jgi:Protoglobin
MTDGAPPRPAGAGYLPATDMPRFVRDMMQFVGLGDDDLAAIRRSAPIVLRHEPSLTAALYEHFLAFQRSAKFFLREDGEVDTARLERRKHSLGRWLRESAEAALTHEFSYYLLSVGLAHGHREQATGAIPPHLMVGAISLAQTALASDSRTSYRRPRPPRPAPPGTSSCSCSSAC